MALGGMNNTLLVFAVLAAIFNLMVTTIFFVTRRKYTVSIQKLCGMTKKNLIWAYGKDMFLIITGSFLSMLFLITFFADYLGSFFTLEQLTWHHWLMSAGTLLVLGIATTGYIVRLAERVNISDTLKGR